MSDRLVLEREQRRMAVVSLIVAVWVLGTAVLGVADALGYLAPALVLLALLALGRYPGEDAYVRRLTGRIATRRPRAIPLWWTPPVRAVVARGGVLLAAGLAGRAPPVVRV
jgi:hypothetical protein